MNKQLPKRAASRLSYAFWFLVACIGVAYGFVLLGKPEANHMMAWALIIGFVGMIMRETVLRRAWKRQHARRNEGLNISQAPEGIERPKVAPAAPPKVVGRSK